MSYTLHAIEHEADFYHYQHSLCGGDVNTAAITSTKAVSHQDLVRVEC